MNNKIQYVLDTFKSCYPTVNLSQITYEGNSDGAIRIHKSVPDDFFDNEIPMDTKNIVWEEWKGIRIPFLFDGQQKEIFTMDTQSIRINYDILASAFYLLSGHQELAPHKKDDMGRFKYSESIQSKLNIVRIPVVNYYFDILKTAIEEFTKMKLSAGIFSNHPYTLCLTHDIDNTENAWIEGSLSAIKKGQFFIPFKLIFAKWVMQKDKWFNFGDILALEQKFQATSSFYFLPRKTKKNGLKNADYDILLPKFRNIFTRIRNAGSEVGIHGSLGTSGDKEELNFDLQKLPFEAKGIRFHFLQYDASTTLETLESTSLKYDTTLGFAECPGFRNSYCLPFYPYNFKKDDKSTILEIPLIVMDSSVASKKYLGLNAADSFDLIVALISEIRKYNGVLTILWHNTFFSDYKYGGWRSVYEKLLAYSTEQGASIKNGEAIYKQIIENQK